MSEIKKHEIEIPELDRDGLRRFGLTFGCIIAVLFGLLLPWLFGFSFPYWPWIVLVVFALWSFIAPDTLTGFYHLWMKFGLLLNAVMSRLILGIVFYLVVWPIGVIFKIRGQDPMHRKIDRDLDTYRVQSEVKERIRMEKPF